MMMRFPRNHPANTGGTATKPPFEKIISGLNLEIFMKDWRIPIGKRNQSMKFLNEKYLRNFPVAIALNAILCCLQKASSNPEFEPIYKNSGFESNALISSTIEACGVTCPPVPPPVRSIRMGLSMFRNIQKHSYSNQCGQHGGAPV